MPVNPYDDRKVSLRRPHGNGDLDIVRASYTRRKANVTEALESLKLQNNLFLSLSLFWSETHKTCILCCNICTS